MVFHDTSANYLKVSLRLCFKNMSQPRPLLSFIFGLFNQTSLQILQQIKIHQVFGTGIWTHDFGYMSLLLCNLRLIHVHYLPKAFRFKMREWRNLLAKDGSLFTLSSTLSIRKVWSTLPIYFTSGTTGSPKMVGHTHGSYGYCHWVIFITWSFLVPIEWLHVGNMHAVGWVEGPRVL